MRIGIAIPLPADNVDISFIARKVEQLGFESIWSADHPIMPVHSESPFPYSPDGIINEHYAHCVDPFVALALAAAVTTTIKLGTGVALVPERNPLLTAKQIATLDLFSGGRFIFGVGTGWHREETEIRGGDFDHRWSQTRESLLVMKKLWTELEAEFHGRYYDFPPVKSYPKPTQKPHPPILLGGMAPNVLQRVVALADGWIPNRVTPQQVEASRKTLNTLAREAGRDPNSLVISVHGQPVDRDFIKALLDAGADRVVVMPSAAPDENAMERELDRIAEAVLR